MQPSFAHQLNWAHGNADLEPAQHVLGSTLTIASLRPEIGLHYHQRFYWTLQDDLIAMHPTPCFVVMRLRSPYATFTVIDPLIEIVSLD